MEVHRWESEGPYLSTGRMISGEWTTRSANAVIVRQILVIKNRRTGLFGHPNPSSVVWAVDPFPWGAILSLPASFARSA